MQSGKTLNNLCHHSSMGETASKANKLKGENGEAKFQNWLDRCTVDYTYFDQTPDTFAPHFRDHAKRPDFLIGFAEIGSIGVDVKAITAFNEEFYFDCEEVKRLAYFQKTFHITVWYVVIKHGTRMAYLIRNDDVATYEANPVGPKGRMVHQVHYDDLYRCDPQRNNFLEALYSATYKTYD